MPDCPKCTRLRTRRAEKTFGRCKHCGRWQFLYQADWALFGGAVYRHLRCVTTRCYDGAWCRDIEIQAEGEECARRAHVHAVGACPLSSGGEE